jgi:aspartate carbamoyltransferase regulatory subunit
MHIRAKCGNPNCVAYGVEKTIVVRQLGNLKTIENELTCRHCSQLMKIIKASADDDDKN